MVRVVSNAWRGRFAHYTARSPDCRRVRVATSAELFVVATSVRCRFWGGRCRFGWHRDGVCDAGCLGRASVRGN